MTSQPTFIIVAGVNGTGKSTFPELFDDSLRINADEILHQMEPYISDEISVAHWVVGEMFETRTHIMEDIWKTHKPNYFQSEAMI